MISRRFFDNRQLGLVTLVESTVTSAATPVIQCDASGKPLAGGDPTHEYRPYSFTNSAGTSNNMVVNATALAPQYFQVRPPTNKLLTVLGVTFIVGATSFNSFDFGGIVNGIPNGIDLVIRQNTTVVRSLMSTLVGTTTGIPIKNNRQMLISVPNSEFHTFNATDSVIKLHFSIAAMSGTNLELDGSLGMNLAFKIQDSLLSGPPGTPIDFMEAQAFGFEVNL